MQQQDRGLDVFHIAVLVLFIPLFPGRNGPAVPQIRHFIICQLLFQFFQIFFRQAGLLRKVGHTCFLRQGHQHQAAGDFKMVVYSRRGQHGTFPDADQRDVSRIYRQFFHPVHGCRQVIEHSPVQGHARIVHQHRRIRMPAHFPAQHCHPAGGQLMGQFPPEAGILTGRINICVQVFRQQHCHRGIGPASRHRKQPVHLGFIADHDQLLRPFRIPVRNRGQRYGFGHESRNEEFTVVVKHHPDPAAEIRIPGHPFLIMERMQGYRRIRQGQILQLYLQAVQGHPGMFLQSLPVLCLDEFRQLAGFDPGFFSTEAADLRRFGRFRGNCFRRRHRLLFPGTG